MREFVVTGQAPSKKRRLFLVRYEGLWLCRIFDSCEVYDILEDE
jgi:hypothetical protein